MFHCCPPAHQPHHQSSEWACQRVSVCVRVCVHWRQRAPSPAVPLSVYCDGLQAWWGTVCKRPGRASRQQHLQSSAQHSHRQCFLIQKCLNLLFVARAARAVWENASRQLSHNLRPWLPPTQAAAQHHSGLLLLLLVRATWGTNHRAWQTRFFISKFCLLGWRRVTVAVMHGWDKTNQPIQILSWFKAQNHPGHLQRSMKR